ncbi:type I secretion system permease/ATPase [Balneatrix alpica]|uniref:Type I secretion system permease/ATPase n=1 Tax=Balneatrix alpica TaxID=75684 RepID=A0ABV5ZEG6_9GAMM|nr:type I secretion system permease/ATPase [Balneatrix alpica]
MTSSSPAGQPDSGLAALVLVARYHQVAADLPSLQHHCGLGSAQASQADLLAAAKRLKLRARLVRAAWQDLAKLSLPAILPCQDGRYLILARCGEDRVLLKDPLLPVSHTLNQAELEQIWTGQVLLLSRRAWLAGAEGRFGLGWFVPALLKYRRPLAEVLVASFFLQLFALLTPLFFQVMVDKVLVHQGLTTLDVLALGLLLLSLFEVVLGGLRTYLFSHTTNRVDVTLGAQLFQHLLHLPIAYFQARQIGSTVARVRELDSIRHFLTSSALTLVIDLFFTLVFFAVMYVYSPTLTLIVAGSIPAYLLLSVYITPLLRKRLDNKFLHGAASQAFLTESVAGIETLKSLAVEPLVQKRWEEKLAAYVSASFKAANLGNIASQSALLINKVVTVLILWQGARLVMGGELSIGQLIAFNMLAGQISNPILKLVQLWQDFQQAGIAVKRLGDILNTPCEPSLQANKAVPRQMLGQLEFSELNFRYSPDRPLALQDFSLRVKAGEVIGIVGRSGSGKSTLARLIQRLYLPESGRILLDGQDISQLQPAWLRRQIGVVLQENRLFNASIKDNIALADPSLPLELVMEAAKLAGAHEFICQLPEGYDTQVGEQGASLSGGQRQRLALARALIGNPRILILDEATSALDYESERLIQDNMAQICRGRTVFIIAHRLSTVRQASRILVLEQGRLVEQGSHAQLLASQGYYARLYAYQQPEWSAPPVAEGLA